LWNNESSVTSEHHTLSMRNRKSPLSCLLLLTEQKENNKNKELNTYII
jgi:hypothetical protein